MNKEWILVLGSLFALGLFVNLYLDYTNQTLQEEELALSVYFLQNVTGVDNATLALDFVEKKMVFESTLYVEGNGILMKTNSKGFQNNDSNCKENLDIVSKDGSERGRTWYDRLPISFEGFGEVDYIEMTKTCDFQDELSPNGEFRVHLFGKDQSVGVEVDEIPFTMIFDSDKYRCNDFCMFSKQFKLLDIEKRDTITILRAEATNPQTTSMRIDLRTENFAAEQMASIFFILIQVGIGATLTIVVYALTTRQQKESHEILKEVRALGRKQKKIIDDQNKRESKKKKTGEFYITSACHVLTLGAVAFFNKFSEFREEKIDSSEWKGYLDQWLQRKKISLDHLQNHHMIYSDVINADTSKAMFELIDQLTTLNKEIFEEDLGNILLFLLFTHINMVAKSLTSQDLQLFLDSYSEFQRLQLQGRARLKTFAQSETIEKTFKQMGLTDKMIKNLKERFEK